MERVCAKMVVVDFKAESMFIKINTLSHEKGSGIVHTHTECVCVCVHVLT